MIDANVTLGHYPFRKLPIDGSDPAAVKDLLQRCGVTRACAGSLNAVFYGDPDQGNDELLPALADDEFYLPVGVINPSLQSWRASLARCIEQYGCRMVRLYPSYHSYKLTDPAVEELLAAATDAGVLVAIVQRLEDERAHHPLMKVPANDLYDVMGTAQRYDRPLLLLSAYLAEIRQLAPHAHHLHFDIAFAETMNTLGTLTQAVDPARLVLGSHSPLLYTEAAVGKLTQWQTDDATRAQVAQGNLARLLGLTQPASV